MASRARPERSRSARSSRQLSRFYHSINPDRVFGTHNCIEAEQDSDLSPAGITRRRAELGRQALTELANFKPFQIAEKATLQNIEHLENKMVDLPQPPTSIADVALAQEIRQYVRSRRSSIDVAVKSIADPRVLGAILNAPPYLSGLSELEFNLVRQRARTTLHPEQSEMQDHT